MNKSLLLFVILVGLLGISQTKKQVCSGGADQVFVPKISNILFRKASVTVPEAYESQIFRTSLKRIQDKYTDVYVNPTSKKAHIRFQVASDKLIVEVVQNDTIQVLSTKVDSRINHQFISVALVIRSNIVELYYAGELRDSAVGQYSLKLFSGKITYQLQSDYFCCFASNTAIYQDLSQEQFQCLIQNENATFKTCKSSQLYINQQCIAKDECLPYSASLYNVGMTGSGVFDRYQNSFNITFQAIDLYVPQCVEGYILDKFGNQISYTGSIVDASFLYSQQDVQNTCDKIDGDYHCTFTYSLYIKKSIYVNFSVKAKLSYGSSENFKKSATVTYGNKFNTFIADQKSQGKAGGVVVNKDFSFSAQIPFNYDTSLQFFTSPLFKFPLNGRPYSYGSDLYVQLQVLQDYRADGNELIFEGATLDGKPILLKSQQLTEEGFLNLTFHPDTLLYSTTVTLELNYFFQYNRN